jgi:16S rRNA G527 N7-methylase RsmG
VRVLQSRAENVAEPGAYRLLTARALDRLAGIIEVGGHLLAPGGRLLALKGQRPDAEIAELPPGWTATAVHALTVPGLDAKDTWSRSPGARPNRHNCQPGRVRCMRRRKPREHAWPASSQ